ncbi:MAG TPA: ZIP family metal transporter [Acidobacteriota bacterium]|nr:ZIP family metal transporter [Acidobacteriota bacterium]
MIELIEGYHPLVQALIATCFTWFLTALGASLVFITRSYNRKLLDGSLGFAAGVMIAASYWSLLAPAIEMAEDGELPAWLPAAVGFAVGAGFVWLIDKLLPHLHIYEPKSAAEGISTAWKRTTLLILAITLHNIPEGLAVGVSFGSAELGESTAGIGSAVALALGIGIQNFPEGMAVSLPLRREGISRFRCFWYGQLSGMVEPIAGVLGAAAVLIARPLLPYAFGFAAGAMIFVVVEEVIPESQRAGDTDLPTLTLIAGFIVMMVLDVALG